jgi:hypothetical protein
LLAASKATRQGIKGKEGAKKEEKKKVKEARIIKGRGGCGKVDHCGFLREGKR